MQDLNKKNKMQEDSFSIFLIPVLVFWIMRINDLASYNNSLENIFFVIDSTSLSLFFFVYQIIHCRRKK